MSTAVGLTPEAIVRLEPDALVLLDQTRLPGELVERRYTNWQDVIEAIRGMVVRGAPAIGVTAAYAVALAAVGDEPNRSTSSRPRRTRLRSVSPDRVPRRSIWAGRSSACVRSRPSRIPTSRSCGRRWWPQRGSSTASEVERCVRIGDHGAELLRAGAQVLTHCNAGGLATAGYGTALGVVCARRTARPAPARLGGRDPSLSRGRG